MRKFNGYTLAELHAEAKARIAAREVENDRLIEQAISNDADLAAEIAYDMANNNYHCVDSEDFIALLNKGDNDAPPKIK